MILPSLELSMISNFNLIPRSVCALVHIRVTHGPSITSQPCHQADCVDRCLAHADVTGYRCKWPSVARTRSSRLTPSQAHQFRSASQRHRSLLARSPPTSTVRNSSSSMARRSRPPICRSRQCRATSPACRESRCDSARARKAYRATSRDLRPDL